MPRGKSAPEGATYVSQNGYHYTKKDGQYTATHILRVEEHLGRKLKPSERVRFKDGNKQNLSIENLQVTVKGNASLETQRARLVARRDELNAQIQDIDNQLELREKRSRLAKLENASSS
jgi:hypothetical protein